MLVAAALTVAACGGDSAPDDATDGSSEVAADVEAEAEDGDGGDRGAGDDGAEPDDGRDDPVAIEPGATVRLLTHDSFSIGDDVFDAFTLETGIDVEVINGGDAGELVARAVLSADDPEGDVLFGVDNTFLQRALDAGIFEAHESPGLDVVPDELELDPDFRVTPIDYGDVCVNYWIDQVDPAPTSLDDLTDPALAASFVTQDPETSSPGFAFLLATIARYGEDGWEDYWADLRDGGVTVTPGWNDAYYGEFVAGGGDKALVTSYGSSPVAEVLFAEEPIEEPPTGVLTDSCFRQIEFAGILAGTEQPEAAAALIDFMLSETFQADIPLNMFVEPVNSQAEVPAEFAEFAVPVSAPLSLPPADIAANQARWTQEWLELLRE